MSNVWIQQQVPDKRGGKPDLSSGPQKQTTATASFITEMTRVSHLQGAFHHEKRGCAAPTSRSLAAGEGPLLRTGVFQGKEIKLRDTSMEHRCADGPSVPLHPAETQGCCDTNPPWVAGLLQRGPLSLPRGLGVGLSSGTCWGSHKLHRFQSSQPLLL